MDYEEYIKRIDKYKKFSKPELIFILIELELRLQEVKEMDLRKYENRESIKQLDKEYLEKVFTYMTKELGRIKNELNRRYRNEMSKADVRKYIEEIAFGKNGKQI